MREIASDSDSGVSPAPLKALPAETKAVPAAEVDVPLPSSPSEDEEKKRTERLASLQSGAESIKDENLRGLALDRLEEIRQNGGSLEGRALAAVDFWDELNGMRCAYTGDDQRCIIQLSELLLQPLSENGCERLDSDSWQPDIQRAIDIDTTLPPGSEPKIVEKYSSGLRVRGRLIRKQEVHLLKSDTTTMNTIFDDNLADDASTPDMLDDPGMFADILDTPDSSPSLGASNMDDNMVIGEPDKLDWEPQHQPDNCAVEAERAIINQFGHDLTQEEAMSISAAHNWYHPGAGTSAADVGHMMTLHGIDNHHNANADISDLAWELQQGHGVIVGVKSGELWENNSLLDDLKEFLCDAFGLDKGTWNPADHAVVVTGIDMSDPANPQVIINDSGHPNGQGAAYPLDKFMGAWENGGFCYTATDEPLPNNEGWDLDSIDWEKWGVALVSGGVTYAFTGDATLAFNAAVSSLDDVDPTEYA